MNYSSQNSTTIQEECTLKNVTAMYLVIGAFTAVGYFIMLRILIQKKLYKNKSRYLIVLYLSITDCTFTLAAAAFNLGHSLVSNGPVCIRASDAGFFIITTAFMLSCCLSAGLSLNQYVAVVSGLRYDAIATRKRIKTLTLFCLAMSAVAVGVGLIDKHTYPIEEYHIKRPRAILSAIVLTTSIIIMTATLAFSSRVSKSHFRQMSLQSRRSRYWQRRQRIRKEVTILTSIVIASLVPHVVFSVKILLDENVDTKLNYYLMNTARGAALLFSALNPYLYLLTLHELRREIVRRFRQHFCCVCCQQKLVDYLARLQQSNNQGSSEVTCTDSGQVNVAYMNEMYRNNELPTIFEDSITINSNNTAASA